MAGGGWPEGVEQMMVPFVICAGCCVMCNVAPLHDRSTSKKTIFEFFLLLSVQRVGLTPGSGQ